VANHVIPIPAMWGGSSTQAPSVRWANQVGEAVNVVFDVASGFTKRPGAKWFKTISDLDETVDYRLHPIVRDETERYLLLYADTMVRIFDMAGTVATVNGLAPGTDARAYLDANDAGCDQMRLVTVADHTLLANTTVPVAAKASDPYEIEEFWRDFGVMVAHTRAAATYHKTEADTPARLAGYFFYDPDPDADGTFATWHRAKAGVGTWAKTDASYWTDGAHNPMGVQLAFRRVDLSDIVGNVAWTEATKKLTKAGAFAGYTPQAGDMIRILDGTDTIENYIVWNGVNCGWFEIDWDNENNDDDNLYLTETICDPVGDEANIKFEGIGAAFEVIVNLTESGVTDLHDVAARLQDTLQGEGALDALIGWTMAGTSNGYLEVTSRWRGADSLVYHPAAPITAGLWNLQADGHPFSNLATATSTAGTGTPATETFAVLDRWTRKPKPNQPKAVLDATTMPIKIARITVDPLVFMADTIEWDPRYTGDEDTNPLPSLWDDGATLADIAFHRNRLALGGGENLVLSQAGEFFSFWIEDYDNLADADPIDQALSAKKVTIIDSLVPFRDAMVMFTKAGEQFEMNAPEVLSYETAAITPSTSYDSIEGVCPATAGGQMYFVANSPGWGQVYEYFYDDSAAANVAAEITSHVAGWLPAGIKTVVASQNQRAVCVLPETGKDIYVYRYFWQEGRKVQSAWVKYTYLYDVIDIAIIGGTVYLLCKQATGDGIRIIAQPLEVEAAPAGMPYLPRLDHWFLATGAYDAGPPAETTWDYTTDDVTIDQVVVGPDFDNAGEILTAERVDDHTIKVAGDYSAHACYLGAKITSEVPLTRPYLRSSDGNTIYDVQMSLVSLALNHRDTGSYSIKIVADGRADRTVVHTPRSGQIEAEGTWRSPIGGSTAWTAVSVYSESVLPFTIVSGEWVVEAASRSR